MLQNKYSSDKIIGIDPGKSGGICLIHNNEIRASKCPDTTQGMSDLFSEMVLDSPTTSFKVVIEKVWARPTDGRVSVFTFAQNYGRWEGIIASHGVEAEYVIPVTWMKHFTVPRGLRKQERKNHIKHLSKELLFKHQYVPRMWKGVPTLATADAIMIAKYGVDNVT